MREMSESSHPPLYALHQLRLGLEHGVLHNLGRPALEAALLGKLDAMLTPDPYPSPNPYPYPYPNPSPNPNPNPNPNQASSTRCS